MCNVVAAIPVVLVFLTWAKSHPAAKTKLPFVILSNEPSFPPLSVFPNA